MKRNHQIRCSESVRLSDHDITVVLSFCSISSIAKAFNPVHPSPMFSYSTSRFFSLESVPFVEHLSSMLEVTTLFFCRLLVSRLEEKDQEMKAEYNKLHSRYTELFKTHVDYMERTKILAGVDRMESIGIYPTLNSSQSISFLEWQG